MKPVEILIVTRSVVLSQGIGALLESLPGITSVKAIQELTSAYTWIESQLPKIVLLDEDILGRVPEAVLEKIRSLSPHTQRALLANDIQQVNLLLTYAEAVLIKGTQPSAIASTITNLLSNKGDEHVKEK
ncbi:MAG: DNA-binding response regulator [Chloroflexi bacterium]|nr:MAG: DNA-binding response regulator [Chloroflexota bacterium]